jgi:hypothetical protein
VHLSSSVSLGGPFTSGSSLEEEVDEDVERMYFLRLAIFGRVIELGTRREARSNRSPSVSALSPSTSSSLIQDRRKDETRYDLNEDDKK